MSQEEAQPENKAQLERLLCLLYFAKHDEAKEMAEECPEQDLEEVVKYLESLPDALEHNYPKIPQIKLPNGIKEFVSRSDYACVYSNFLFYNFLPVSIASDEEVKERKQNIKKIGNGIFFDNETLFTLFFSDNIKKVDDMTDVYYICEPEKEAKVNAFFNKISASGKTGAKRKVRQLFAGTEEGKNLRQAYQKVREGITERNLAKAAEVLESMLFSENTQQETSQKTREEYMRFLPILFSEGSDSTNTEDALFYHSLVHFCA